MAPWPVTHVRPARAGGFETSEQTWELRLLVEVLPHPLRLRWVGGKLERVEAESDDAPAAPTLRIVRRPARAEIEHVAIFFRPVGARSDARSMKAMEHGALGGERGAEHLQHGTVEVGEACTAFAARMLHELWDHVEEPIVPGKHRVQILLTVREGLGESDAVQRAARRRGFGVRDLNAADTQRMAQRKREEHHVV